MNGGGRWSRLGFGLSSQLWLVELGIFLNYLGCGGGPAVRGHLPPRRPRLQPRRRRARRRHRHRPRRRGRAGRRPADRPLRRPRRPPPAPCSRSPPASPVSPSQTPRRRRSPPRSRPGRQRRAAPEPVDAAGLARAAGAAPPRHRRLARRRQPRRRARRRARRPGRSLRVERLRRALPGQRPHLPALRARSSSSPCAKTRGRSRSRAATGSCSRDRPFVRLALDERRDDRGRLGRLLLDRARLRRGQIGVSTRLIGLLLLANALTVVARPDADRQARRGPTAGRRRWRSAR